MRIFKYELDSRVLMPEGAKILAVQVYHNRPILLALADPDKPLVPKMFRVVYTGQKPNRGDNYIGTFDLFNTVHHVFEVTDAV